MTGTALFRRVLVSEFERLAPRVREVHGGTSRQLRGLATVTRGNALLGRLIGRIASLPDAQHEGVARIELIVDGRGETWIRHFGASRPMRSRLCARDGLLVEQLGPAQLRFRLREHDGAVVWDLQSVSLLGLPAPRSWFAATTARSYEQAGRYCFEVDVRLPFIGHLIGYRGSISSMSSVRIA